MIVAACTGLTGLSAWFEHGFVAYSNAVKTELLGVGAALIAHRDAAGEPLAHALELGAIRHFLAGVSVAVTGVAGPTRDSAAKPVGTMSFCLVCLQHPSTRNSMLLASNVPAQGNSGKIMQLATC